MSKHKGSIFLWKNITPTIESETWFCQLPDKYLGWVQLGPLFFVLFFCFNRVIRKQIQWTKNYVEVKKNWLVVLESVQIKFMV